MSLDPKVEQAIQAWWLTQRGSRDNCPVCGRSALKRDVADLAGVAIMIVCTTCGHAYVFPLESLKNAAGIK